MKMRTIFIYMLLDDLKIKICNDALSYIHRNDDYRLVVDLLFNQRFKVGYRFMIYI
ncbi:hypothetical protein BACCOPRO_01647, partial [Phocaeicola coprophilus DSM 18228 = JCM 13818]